MFVRNEWDDTVEIYKTDEVSVKPKGNTQWLLFMVGDVDDTEINIGIFESVGEANKALISLRQAIQASLGWDFNQYRKESKA